MAQVGGVYLNFGLWAFAVLPAWIVIRGIGVVPGDRKVDLEEVGIEGERGSRD